jgi:hypothetical protein
MATQYQTWLQSLGALRADLGTDGRQVRGLAVSHTLNYPGDVTDATLEGAVKASPDATSELATFTIGTPVFSGGVTTWTFSLAEGSGANSTGALPADGDGDGLAYFIYDLVLTLAGGSAQRVCGGLFVISGFVTEPA